MDGTAHGPFISFEMDVWNSDGTFFADKLGIALDNNTFLDYKYYDERHPVVIDIVTSYVYKLD